MERIKLKLLIDFESKDFTYGNRIAMSDIFGNEALNEYEQMKAAFKELHGFDAKWLPIRRRIKAFQNIAQGLKRWIDQEKELLNYEPSADELAAGVKELGKKVGNLSTIKALAKAYGKDPDEVLKWDYSKVFGILYTDLEERKYENRLNKRIYGRAKSNKFGR